MLRVLRRLWYVHFGAISGLMHRSKQCIYWITSSAGATLAKFLK